MVFHLIFIKKKKIHIPQLIFGELLTSSNYKKDEKKIVGGKNGYGVKLANIFSNVFTITTVDKINQKKYNQTWKKNMTICEKPNLRKFSGKPFTEISWDLDFKIWYRKVFSRRLHLCIVEYMILQVLLINQ